MPLASLVTTVSDTVSDCGKYRGPVDFPDFVVEEEPEGAEPSALSCFEAGLGHTAPLPHSWPFEVLGFHDSLLLVALELPPERNILFVLTGSGRLVGLSLLLVDRVNSCGEAFLRPSSSSETSDNHEIGEGARCLVVLVPGVEGQVLGP